MTRIGVHCPSYLSRSRPRPVKSVRLSPLDVFVESTSHLGVYSVDRLRPAYRRLSVQSSRRSILLSAVQFNSQVQSVHFSYPGPTVCGPNSRRSNSPIGPLLVSRPHGLRSKFSKSKSVHFSYQDPTVCGPNSRRSNLLPRSPSPLRSLHTRVAPLLVSRSHGLRVQFPSVQFFIALSQSPTIASRPTRTAVYRSNLPVDPMFSSVQFQFSKSKGRSTSRTKVPIPVGPIPTRSNSPSPLIQDRRSSVSSPHSMPSVRRSLGPTPLGPISPAGQYASVGVQLPSTKSIPVGPTPAASLQKSLLPVRLNHVSSGPPGVPDVPSLLLSRTSRTPPCRRGDGLNLRPPRAAERTLGQSLRRSL
ncbi:hypothetical protein TNIN_280781 [Trichonephila inaurata madagascariensis]|uniref:Uncharacterized protein n=1 Tax=Trichonephila inaurata madagascariensis TaxID=2747483 RepID=A0A8X7BX54_9ARAC|nr:hypothetical protein TNIN_280781 [Trichonephila inaurata madagascariensis]